MLLKAFVAVLVVGSLISFVLYGVDKAKAKRNAWRIPEATLMGVAAIGGSIGALAGMYYCRHKTKHIKFTLGIPVILIGQIALVIWLAA